MTDFLTCSEQSLPDCPGTRDGLQSLPRAAGDRRGKSLGRAFASWEPVQQGGSPTEAKGALAIMLPDSDGGGSDD